jgi:hypothetical protein
MPRHGIYCGDQALCRSCTGSIVENYVISEHLLIWKDISCFPNEEEGGVHDTATYVKVLGLRRAPLTLALRPTEV